MSPSGEALFRTIIEAKTSTFSESYSPSPRGHGFTRNSANPKPRLAKKGVILETHGFPMVFLGFLKNLGHAVAV